MLVMLRLDWPADTFRRAGTVFSRGIPVDLDDTAMKSIAQDLGHSLVLIDASTAKADHDQTAEAAADLDAFLKSKALGAGLSTPTLGSQTAEPSPAASPSAAEPPKTTEPPKHRRR